MTNHKKGSELQDYRITIDNLDTSLLFLLAERTRMITKAAIAKKTKNMKPELSPEREKDLQETIAAAQQHGLNTSFVIKLFKCIYTHALPHIEKVQAELDDHEEVIEYNLPDLRKSVFNIDNAICFALAERFRVSLKVGAFKQERQLPALDKERWEQLLNDKIKKGEQLGVDKKLIHDLFEIIHDESLRLQEENL